MYLCICVYVYTYAYVCVHIYSTVVLKYYKTSPDNSATRHEHGTFGDPIVQLLWLSASAFVLLYQ